MAALTGPRNTQEMEDHGRRLVYPVADNVLIYVGAIVALNAQGYAEPGQAAAGLAAIGRCEFGYPGGLPGTPGQNADNTQPGHAPGAVSVLVRRGVFKYDNSSGADLIGMANVGASCFMADDHTVALTDGSVETAVAEYAATVPSTLFLALAHKNVAAGSVLVQNSAKTTTYVEGTDYVVDYVNGIVFFEGATLVSAAAIEIGYSYMTAASRSVAGAIVKVDTDNGVWVDFTHQGVRAS